MADPYPPAPIGATHVPGNNDKPTKAVALDWELENGVLPIGQVVHVTTVTFAYRGVLTAATPSYYRLDNPVVVGDAGEWNKYMDGANGEEESKPYTGYILVERGASTCIWVFSKPRQS